MAEAKERTRTNAGSSPFFSLLFYSTLNPALYNRAATANAVTGNAKARLPFGHLRNTAFREAISSREGITRR